jgi:hypothetical protein
MNGAFTNLNTEAGGWLASAGYRYFQSDRHFSGDKETRNAAGQTRIEAGTQVINTVHSFDAAATYIVTPRWSVTFDIPFIEAERSSLYEHGATINGNKRFSMYSSGLGDIRLTTDYWLFDPASHPNGNIALGIGGSAPTGDDRASDVSHRATGDVIRPVDQSIQPGSGGWGIILQLQAYQQVYKSLYAYLNGSYTLTPEGRTDVETPNGDKIADTPGHTKYNSIPDQYLGRAGLSYEIWPSQGLAFTLGGRVEGVPAYDAIGSSLGFRRPGYVVSIEPGFTWMHKRHTLSTLFPVALYRNRVHSAAEIANGTGTGDAAFADYSILASYTYRF